VRMPIAPPTSVDDLLETGLLNQWYLVARDTDIGNTPVGLKRLSRNIVLWRDGQGKVHAVDDFCPHRGAKLSLGRVCEGEIACEYHGIQVNGDGVVTATSPTPTSPMVGKKLVVSYPCEERYNVIWVYFSDGLDPTAETPPLRVPDEFTTGEWSGFVDIREFAANWQLVRDNQFDPVHGSYLHFGTHALSWGSKEADMGYQRTDRGFVVWRKNQQATNLDKTWLEHYPNSGLWAITDIPYPKKEGGGWSLGRLFRFPTPIDRENTLVWNYRMQPLAGWKRDLWRFLYRNRASARGAEVLAQDARALTNIPMNAYGDEHLLPCDVGVQQIRRAYREEATKQFEAISLPLTTAGA
jgi:phenylpropionate dioxygenase-like ring-hydroxylating dioxygenase large terminal subunit